jgi:hypothetical protein
MKRTGLRKFKFSLEGFGEGVRDLAAAWLAQSEDWPIGGVEDYEYVM